MLQYKQYTQQTTAFYKELQSTLRKAGYTYKRTKQSAQEFLRWDNGTNEIEIAGWHGDAGWGPGRCVLNMYINREEVAEVVSTITDVDKNCVLLDHVQACYASKLEELKDQINQIKQQ